MKSRSKRVLVILAVAAISVLAGIGFLRAQSTQITSGRLPTFEVASIKPNPSGTPDELVFRPGGRFEATDVTPRELIADAYAYRQPNPELRDNQILGGPKWINSKRYDIEAKVSRSVVESEEKKLPLIEWRDQIQLMIQSLLADRFKLRVKEESVQRPAYALVVAKSGPKMPRAEAPPPEPSIDAPSPPWGRPSRMGLIAPGNFNLHAFTLREFADRLTNMPELVGRPVFDQTGLSGAYDFILHWTPMAFGPPSNSSVIPESNGPSLFSALQEQLGLRLVSTRGPVYVVVIEHIEEPTPN